MVPGYNSINDLGVVELHTMSCALRILSGPNLGSNLSRPPVLFVMDDQA